MLQLRFLFLMLCILIRFNFLLSEFVFLCYKKSLEINCKADDQYLVIKDAIFGYIPSFKNLSMTYSNECIISDSIMKQNPQDCKISLLKNISHKCSGIKSCKVEYLYSHYLQKDSLPCPEISNNYQILTLYINYECIPKDLFFPVGNLDNIQFIGGYITSIGYHSQKANERDDYEETLSHFKSIYNLPVENSFRPKTQLEKRLISPIVFQFRILENSLFSNEKTSIINSNDNCQMGLPKLQDYYAFIPMNKSILNYRNVDGKIIICPSSHDLVGQSLEPIIAKQIITKININFTVSQEVKALLIKFTTIFCPPLFITNAKVVYDHKLVDADVVGFAKIECHQSYFISSSINISTAYLNCNHDSGTWDQPPESVICTNSYSTKLSLVSTSPHILSIQTTKLTTLGRSTISVPVPISKSDSSILNDNVTVMSTGQSTMPITEQTKTSNITIFLLATTISSSTSSSKYIFSGLSIVLLAFCICGYVLYRNKCKFSCFSTNCTPLKKFLDNNNDNDYPSWSRDNNHSAMKFRNSILYMPTMENVTPVSGSLLFIGGHPFLSNNSCMQSNRTLVTRFGSRPTIGSRNSYPWSSNLSDININQIHNGDGLPTKIPKQSSLKRMLRSANSFLSNSPTTFTPISLSRRSFNGSQLPLLNDRRNCINSEVIEIPPIMWTSDISSSTIGQKYFERSDSKFGQLSKSDVALKQHTKICSPTIDTYLEPTAEFANQLDEESSFTLSPNERRINEEYMIYDHSRKSSSNIDSTCPSSMTGSILDANRVDDQENKRFSMISNSYYGIQNPDLKTHCQRPVNTSAQIPEIGDSHYENSNESVYESIDDGPLCQNTLDRRKLALPLPPKDY